MRVFADGLNWRDLRKAKKLNVSLWIPVLVYSDIGAAHNTRRKKSVSVFEYHNPYEKSSGSDILFTVYAENIPCPVIRYYFKEISPV